MSFRKSGLLAASHHHICNCDTDFSMLPWNHLLTYWFYWKTTPQPTKRLSEEGLAFSVWASVPNWLDFLFVLSFFPLPFIWEMLSCYRTVVCSFILVHSVRNTPTCSPSEHSQMSSAFLLKCLIYPSSFRVRGREGKTASLRFHKISW